MIFLNEGHALMIKKELVKDFYEEVKML